MAGNERTNAGRLTPGRRRILDRLLDRALDLEPGERARFVAECCTRAPRTGAWLKRLLAATTAPTGLVDGSARHLVGEALESREGARNQPLPVDTRLGPWRLLEPVGAGGMGEVYRAERADGTFEMAAAVKVIRSHSEQLSKLLAFERQTLARLSHAAIAHLLDGGVTEDGRPYLVMEWVDGDSLDDWIVNHDPDVDALLDVFGQACAAISAAHRQLVVHGDIKPTNLIVTPQGQVKLVDFGVARLLGARKEVDLPGALTPGYAAPEQLTGSTVSTATDIYSLGALLFWMIHGRAPGPNAPDRPLSRWSQFRRLSDLHAIVDRAMAEDPEDRYATVNGMAVEIRRLRTDFPVHARRPGAVERVGLWVRRHRVGAALGAVAAASIIIGVSVTLWQARIVALERDVARTEAALSETVREHLILLFREVGSLADDTESLTARELLDRTADVAGDWLEEEPQVQQQVLAVLGEVMIALHDYSSAEPLLAEFVDVEDEALNPVLRSMALRDLAQAYHRQGRLEEGFEAIDRAVGLIEGFPGSHPARLSDVLQVRGRLHRDLGRFNEAVADLRRARDLAQEAFSGPRPLTARAENNLAITLLMGGQLADAARHLEAAEALWYALGRSESNDALAVMANLAVVLDRLGRTSEAEQRLRKVIEIRHDRYGDSGALAAAELQLGRLLVVRGDYEEAAGHLEYASETFRRFVGEGSPDYAASLIGRGELANARGEHAEALALFETALDILDGTVGPSHPYALQAGLELIATREMLEEPVDDDDYAELVERARRLGGSGQMVLAAMRCQQARHRLRAGVPDRARSAATECLEIREALGLGGWRTTEASLIAAVSALLASGSSATLQAGQEQFRKLVEQTHREHPVVAEVRAQAPRLEARPGAD